MRSSVAADMYKRQLRHGSKLRSLPTLREMLRRAEQENKDDNKNTK